MRIAVLPVLLVSAALASGCGNDKASHHEAKTACAGEGIVVSDAWVRAAPAGRPMSAGYLTLCNGGETTAALTGALFGGAANVELHASSLDENGVASMTPLASLPVPVGGEASMAPGGAHIMLIGLTAPLEAGETVEMTLEFENAPPQTVSFEVRDAAPGGHH